MLIVTKNTPVKKEDQFQNTLIPCFHTSKSVHSVAVQQVCALCSSAQTM